MTRSACAPFLALLLLAPAGSAQTLVHEIFGGASFPTLGSGVAGLGDVDGDGLPDFATAGIMLLPGAPPFVIVRTYSGASGSLIHEYTTPAAPTLAPHVKLLRAGDTNGDGIDDLALGVYDGVFLVGIGTGKIELLDGATGSLLHTLSATGLGGRLGSAFDAGPDLDGDGLSDVVALTQLGSTGVQVHAFSGGTGSLIPPPGPGTIANLSNGESLAIVGDQNGNGATDVLVGSPQDEVLRMATVHGALQQVINPCLPYVPCCTQGCYIGPGVPRFGSVVISIGAAAAGSATGFAVSRPFDDCFNPNLNPKVFVYPPSGSTCSFTIALPLQPGDGVALASVPDVDADGVVDLAVANGPLSSAVRVFSGSDGTHLMDLPLPAGLPLVLPPAGGPVNAVAGLGDLNGDGLGEIVVGQGTSGLLRVYASADLQAGVTVLGTGGGFGPYFPTLGSSTPTLPGLVTLSIGASPPLLPGILAVAPAPENPFPILPGVVIWPDLAQVATWSLVPFTTSVGGSRDITFALPADPRLAATEAVLQAWFPSSFGFSGLLVTNGLRLRAGY